MDAAARDIAERMAEVGKRGRALGADAREPRGDAAGGGQEEVARAAGGVDDRQSQQGLGGIVRLGLSLVEHGVERGVEQRLNQAVGRVVGAGDLALVALLLGGLGGEEQGLAVIAQLGLQFEEGFVDGPQFLGLHRAPVDGDHAGFLVEPGEAVERLHEGAVAQAGGLEMGQPIFGKEAAEGGQRKSGLAVCEGAEDDLHPLVAVMVLVPGGGAVALLAQRLERIALGVEGAGLGLGLFGMQEVPVLGHHKEDQAVDEAQEFVEPFGQVDLAGAQF